MEAPKPKPKPRTGPKPDIITSEASHETHANDNIESKHEKRPMIAPKPLPKLKGSVSVNNDYNVNDGDVNDDNERINDITYAKRENHMISICTDDDNSQKNLSDNLLVSNESLPHVTVPKRDTFNDMSNKHEKSIPAKGLSNKSVNRSASLTSQLSRSRAGSENVDSTGRYLMYDVREDEEQIMKMQEIIDLLVAGGYFRARIKGLSNFDKIIGGMSWAIEMSNEDIDVDILFHESLSIGQKIALTEKIVKVLHKMKCPHQLEPHQIQGLDCIHIFPVIQWLVKKSIETRQQMGVYIKSYSCWQFNKCHNLSRDITESKRRERSSQSIIDTDTVRHPRRKYRHPSRHKILDEETKVKTTLLEYGSFTSASVRTEESSTNVAGDAVPERRESDSKVMESLINSMTSEKLLSGRVSAAFVGSIVGAQSDEIQKLAEEYQRKRNELIENSVERKEMIMRRKVEMAKRDVTIAIDNEAKVQEKLEILKEQITNVKEKQKEYTVNDNETDAEREEKKNLSQILETLKKQKSEFRTFCREEKVRIEKQIEELANHTDTEDESELEHELDGDRDKHTKLKLQLASRNKEIAKMQRKLDDIPSRAELSQYQKRFVELYNQIAAKHNETKKFYTLYNTLDDERIYLEKEFNLLNSILENFYQSQSSTSSKEQFLLQFETIVDGIKQTKLKMETRRQTEKMKRDQLNEQYLDLIEKQRLYYKAVKDFKEECRKNESLIASLQEKQSHHE